MVNFNFTDRRFDSQYVKQICGLQIFDRFSSQVNGKSTPQGPEAGENLTVDISIADPMDTAVIKHMPDVIRTRQQPRHTHLIAAVITAEYPGKFAFFIPDRRAIDQQRA